MQNSGRIFISRSIIFIISKTWRGKEGDTAKRTMNPATQMDMLFSDTFFPQAENFTLFIVVIFYGPVAGRLKTGNDEHAMIPHGGDGSPALAVRRPLRKVKHLAEAQINEDRSPSHPRSIRRPIEMHDLPKY